MRRFVVPAPNGPVTPRGPPTFSVVIAAYQSAGTIAEAVASALGQTAPPREVIVCDDGSTDDLRSALAPFGDRVAVLRKENGGEASAKNAAARAAAGEFVAVLDADDIYLPERLAALGELAGARPDLDILTTDAFLEVGGRRVRRSYERGHTFAATGQRRAILERNFVFGLAAVRRETFLASGGFDETIRVTTDWELWARLILNGSVAGLVDEPLAVYRISRASLSADQIALLEGRIETLTKLLGHPRIAPDERDVAWASLRKQRGRLALARARVALAEEAPGARRLSMAVARDAGQTAATRVKALMSAMAPKTAGRRIAASGNLVDAGGVRGAGGLD